MISDFLFYRVTSLAKLKSQSLPYFFPSKVIILWIRWYNLVEGNHCKLSVSELIPILFCYPEWIWLKTMFFVCKFFTTIQMGSLISPKSCTAKVCSFQNLVRIVVSYVICTSSTFKFRLLLCTLWKKKKVSKDFSFQLSETGQLMRW